VNPIDRRTDRPLVQPCAERSTSGALAFELARLGKLDTITIGARRHVSLESMREIWLRITENVAKLLEHEPAWNEFQQAMLEFIGQQATNFVEDPVVATLTERERTALRLLCQGKSNAQIGWELGIAERTARNHIFNLYRKLGVHSRAQAIALAHQHPLSHSSR
jgi:DNA-binding NarL/FixJ family response regulator